MTSTELKPLVELTLPTGEGRLLATLTDGGLHLTSQPYRSAPRIDVLEAHHALALARTILKVYGER